MGKITLTHHLKIDEDLHRELTKLKGEMGKKTYSQVIWELVINHRHGEKV